MVDTESDHIPSAFGAQGKGPSIATRKKNPTRKAAAVSPAALRQLHEAQRAAVEAGDHEQAERLGDVLDEVCDDADCEEREDNDGAAGAGREYNPYNPYNPKNL